MIVQRAQNGWYGIFIPGDEALGLSSAMQQLAICLDDGSLGCADASRFLRQTSKELSECRSEKVLDTIILYPGVIADDPGPAHG